MEYYFFGITDHETRFLEAIDVADRKDGYNATKLLEDGVVRTKKIPDETCTDKLPSYSEAYEKVYAPRNPLDNDSVHLANAPTDVPYGDCDDRGRIHIDNAGINKHNKYNNNIQERFNSTQRTCFRPRRGIKIVDSPITGSRFGSTTYANTAR